MLDTAAEPVAARVMARDGGSAGDNTHEGGRHVGAVTFTSPPALVVAPGVSLTIGHRRIAADLARCGGLYAVVDAEQAGAGLAPAQVGRLRELAAQIIDGLPPADRAAAEGVIFTGPPHGDADLRAIPVYTGGCLDRSASGLGLAALTAVLDAMGLASESLRVEGAAGLLLQSRIADRLEVEGQPAIRAEITGSAWITGEHTFIVDAEDPLAEGWPGPGR